MTSSDFYLLIEYTNGVEKSYTFSSWQEAYAFVHAEGDHVADWSINGE